MAGCVALALNGCSGGVKLSGTDLGKTPAPNFTLNDASGVPFSLGEMRGQAVLLTFLYTNCPDICPAIAGKLAEAYTRLGDSRKRVSFIAVSVDPSGDTPQSVAQFTSEHGLGALGSRWRYGLGNQETLSAVWQAYYIGARPRPAGGNVSSAAPQPVAVDHEAVMYLIDRQGRERSLVRPDITVQQLVDDLKALASE
jgi:protein SCO1/2